MAMQGQGFGGGSTNNANSAAGNGQLGLRKFDTVPWTPDEQAILEKAFPLWASESNLIRYARIAALLKNKTVRDVALRCRWMAKEEIARRRKEELNPHKPKARKVSKSGLSYGDRWAPY